MTLDERISGTARKIAFRYGVSCEDAVQEGRIAAFLAASTYDVTRKSEDNYLHDKARYAMLDYVKRECNHRARTETLPGDYEERNGKSDVDWVLAEDALVSLCHNANSLQGRIITLLIAGLSQTQIAERLGQTRQNINHHVNHIRKQLIP